MYKGDDNNNNNNNTGAPTTNADVQEGGAGVYGDKDDYDD